MTVRLLFFLSIICLFSVSCKTAKSTSSKRKKKLEYQGPIKQEKSDRPTQKLFGSLSPKRAKKNDSKEKVFSVQVKNSKKESAFKKAIKRLFFWKREASGPFGEEDGRAKKKKNADSFSQEYGSQASYGEKGEAGRHSKKRKKWLKFIKSAEERKINREHKKLFNSSNNKEKELRKRKKKKPEMNLFPKGVR